MQIPATLAGFFHRLVSRKKQGSRPKTGQRIGRDKGRSGDAELIVDNGNRFDGIVILRDEMSGLLYRSYYIRAGEKAHIRGIASGSYRLMYVLGKVWHHEFKRFIVVEQSQRFDEVMVFRNDSSITITLHPVPMGGATTSNVPESSVPRL